MLWQIIGTTYSQGFTTFNSTFLNLHLFVYSSSVFLYADPFPVGKGLQFVCDESRVGVAYSSLLQSNRITNREMYTSVGKIKTTASIHA